MPTTRNPRRGSMQVWPRKRARRIVARVRSFNDKIRGLAGFAGYKTGMTHLMIQDRDKEGKPKGSSRLCPATIVECPPVKVFAVNVYKNTPYGLALSSTILSPSIDKELARKVRLPKKYDKSLDSIKEFDSLRLLAYTQPKLTSIGKKKPELFELYLGGTKDEQLSLAKEYLTRDIKVSDVFKEGSQIDVHAVTKGKGLQGPVRRFGVKIRFHKSEKTKRGPGSLGSWMTPTTHRVAHAGQMGFHQRTDYNKKIVKIDNDASKINPKGGWLRYGLVKNEYLIIKGSLPGPSKRLVTMIHATRPNVKISSHAPQINYVHKESRQ
ncbi:50S ribosomal protein L3 [Candidatus Woesearchaeota archaeon]|nr:50S ribosomal protein L3 [Candidatus Woesearchaeota archaeon]